MMPGDEPRHDLDDVGRHRHGFDQIIPGVRKRLAFRRIGRDGQQFIRRIRRNGTHNHPERGGRNENQGAESTLALLSTLQQARQTAALAS